MGCSNSPTKTQESATTEPVYQVFDKESIKAQVVDLADFGPNPYYANPIQIDTETKAAFKSILKKINKQGLEQTESELTHFVNNHPELSGAAYNLALLHYKLGQVDQATTYAKKAMLQNPNNLDARNLLGLLAREQGDFNKAEALWLDNLYRWGGYAPSYKNLAILYDLYLGKPKKALSYYKQYHHFMGKKDKLVGVWIKSIDRKIAADETAKALAKANKNGNNETSDNPSSSVK